MNKTISMKGVLSGDSAVGKTSLAIRKLRGAFPEEYVPVKIDYETVPVELTDANGKNFVVHFRDVEGGGEDWHALRHLEYTNTDVVVLCFSVSKPSSFESIEEYWSPFLKKYVPEADILLVGTQSDLRNDALTIEQLQKHNLSLVSIKQGKKMAKKINAFAYLECSALLNEGVDEVFDTAAAKAASRVKSKEKNEKKCIIF